MPVIGILSGGSPELFPLAGFRQGLQEAGIVGGKNAEMDARSLQAAARTLGRRIEVLKAASERDLETAFAAIAEQRLGALFVNIDSFFAAHAGQLVALAARHRVPASYPLRSYVAAGGLMSYDASYTDAFRRAGVYV